LVSPLQAAVVPWRVPSMARSNAGRQFWNPTFGNSLAGPCAKAPLP